MIRKEGGYLLCDLLHKCIIVWSTTPISKRDEVVGDGVGEQRKGLLKHINAIAGVRRLVVGIRRDPHKLLVACLEGYPNCERSSVFGNHPTSRHRRPTARPYHSLYLDTSNDTFTKSKPKLEKFVVTEIQMLLHSKLRKYSKTVCIYRHQSTTHFPKSAPNLRAVSCYIANAITRETSKTCMMTVYI